MKDIIVIGAGASGLQAAWLLAKQKYNVTIVEARDRIGGRVHTVTDQGFRMPVEAGAEFIHGEMPHTMDLMNQLNVKHHAGEGKSWSVEKNIVSEGDLFHEGWEILMQKLKSLKNDTTIANFLVENLYEEKYQSLKDEVIRFVQGYDAADIHKVSAMALYEEWAGENIKGYRPDGGYGQLMNFLLEQSHTNNATLKLSSPVTIVRWKKNLVEVITQRGETLTAERVIITIPVNVLKSGDVKFEPNIKSHIDAFHQLEVGGVIKFLFEFHDRFWESAHEKNFRQMKNLHFLFSDAVVPTWWTQHPMQHPLLTGWLAGPAIERIKQDDQTLLNLAVESLAYCFNCKVNDIQAVTRNAKVFNWAADPFAQGAYAYKTLQTAAAIKKITTPVEDTLFFAGEALYDGAEMGTVEAALASGKAVADLVTGDR